MRVVHAALLLLATAIVVAMLGACAGPASSPRLESTPSARALATPLPSPPPTASGKDAAPTATAVVGGESGTPTATVPGPASTATPRPGSSGVPTGRAGEPNATITGQVRDVALSARVITFAEPVHGFAGVAVQEDTEIVSADGSAMTLGDIKPGMVIQASGGATGSGAVLATRVRILSGPTPLAR